MSAGTTPQPPRSSTASEREDIEDALSAFTRTASVLLASGVTPYMVIGGLAVALGSAIRGLPAGARAGACEAFTGVVQRKALAEDVDGRCA